MKEFTCDVIVGSPEVDVDGVEETQESEPPRNSVDDDTLALGEELVDNSPKQKDVNNGPGREKLR